MPPPVDVSDAAGLLVVGYYRSGRIDVWSIKTGSLLSSFRSGGVEAVRFDAAGSRIAVTNKRGTGVCDLMGSSLATPAGVHGVQQSDIQTRRNALLLPLRRRPGLMMLELNTLREERVDLTVVGSIVNVRCRPDGGDLIVVGRRCGIACVDANGYGVNWAVNLLEVVDHVAAKGAGAGVTWSGDGTRVAALVAWEQGWETVVLDATSGRVERILRDTRAIGYPAEGPCILTDDGMEVDLERGVCRVVAWE